MDAFRKAFLRYFPTLRPEVSCAVSITGVLGEEYEGPGGRSPASGLSWDSVVFLVLMVEFLVLGFGAIEVISSRRELAKMMESRNLDPVLLALTLGTAAALWVSHAVFGWTQPGALALLMINIVVAVGVVRIWTRKPEREDG